MFSIKKIDIKRDEGSVMSIIEQNIQAGLTAMKAKSICPACQIPFGKEGL
nr:hypothetical protein [uncultured Methanobacterium sp.]